MASPGTIYAMINPALKGLVKVGFTTLNSEARAQQLSCATGIPEPFFVVHENTANDCQLAEKIAHTILESQGFRLKENREFFNAPLKIIIEAIDNACDQTNSTVVIKNDINIDNLIDKLECEFIDAYCGNKNGWRDFEKAIEIGEKLLTFKHPEAHAWLGNIYRNDDFKSTYNPRKAEHHYKEAIRMGRFECASDLAQLMDEQDRHQEAESIWKIFFTNVDFAGLEDEDKEIHVIPTCMYIWNREFDHREWKYLDRMTPIIYLMIRWIESKITKSPQLARVWNPVLVKLEHATL